jgi:hypothetical protein
MAEEGTLDELRALGADDPLGLGGGQMRRAEVPELAIPVWS